MTEEPDETEAERKERVRQWFENYSTRRHSVDLERVQRVHLGIDNEPMEFTAVTVAKMLQEVADNCDENEAFTLHAVVRALLGKDEHHELVLKQRKPGKFFSPTEHETKHNRDSMWLARLAGLERRGCKTEAAIAEIAQREDVSRATVFSAIRDAEKFLKSGREMFPGSGNFENPRPDKKRNC